MEKKDLNRQFHGAVNAISGYGYEVNFFVAKLVDMFIEGSTGYIVNVTRTKRNNSVDDVLVKTKTVNSFYQCRLYANYNSELFSALLIQFRNDQTINIILVTQNKDKHYSKLSYESRNYAYKTFVNNLENDTQLKKCKEKFGFLCSLLNGDLKSKDKKQKIIYNFLKKFSIEVFDETNIKEAIRKKLEYFGYSDSESKAIYNELSVQANESNWQDKAINFGELKQILNGIGISYPPTINNKPEFQKFHKKINPHVLENPKTKFYEKISHLIDLIGNLNKPQVVERKRVLKIIEENDILSWHFFKNLKDVNWFPEIKDNLIKSVIREKVDRAVKYQLLTYLGLCLDNYTDNIIPLLVEFEKNAKNPHILIAFVKISAKIKPSNKKDLKQIWAILEKLSENSYPLLRKEIPNTLESLCEYDLDKSLKILGKLILLKIEPKDVTLGSPTFAATFQGRDMENSVFKESAKLLSKLMADKKIATKAFNFAINLEVQFIKQVRGKPEKNAGITLDHSSIWLSNEISLEKLEYMYDRKERVALEIERRLEQYAASDFELTKELCSKLLQAKYEVFHLAVIKVLTRHIEQYLDLVEHIVFNKDLWVIRNIQNYFLQTLIRKYFELRQNRLSEYVGEVNALTYKGNSKSADYFKQDLFVSIPENLRTEDIKKELERLNIELKTENEITKPFEIRTADDWAEPKLDISIEEIRMKNEDEIINIMEESTAGKGIISPRDLANLFKDFIKGTPERLQVLLEKMEGKQIESVFLSGMVSGYLQSEKADLKVVIDSFWKIQKSDTWIRREVANYLDKECRKEEIQRIDLILIEEIKKVLFDLMLDKHPENNETIKSSNPRPDDGVTRGINSIRGVTAGALIWLLHYFPKDKDIPGKIKILSDDSTNAVKSALIYYLRLISKDNYSLCQSIVNKFKNCRDPEIDCALLYYFSSLNSSKCMENIDFIKLLFTDKNKQIQEMLGKLVGEHYIYDGGLEDLVNKIVKGSIGEKEARISLAFILESRLEGLIAKKKYKNIIQLLAKLLDTKQEPEVRFRASYFLDRDEFKMDYFPVLNKYKIIDVILKDDTNIMAQSHVINYLHRCILEGKFVEQSIDILYKQTMKIDMIWDDQLIVNKIAEIVKNRFQNQSIKEKSLVNDKIDAIFDKGLEKGWELFYDLFYEFKQKKN
ncbi:MAG: hypothetical protein AB1498_01485 [bacterium]